MCKDNQYLKELYGHDVLAIECLYHSIELYLNNITTAHDGNTKAPDKLVKDYLFNLISPIKVRDLTESNLK